MFGKATKIAFFIACSYFAQIVLLVLLSEYVYMCTQYNSCGDTGGLSLFLYAFILPATGVSFLFFLYFRKAMAGSVLSSVILYVVVTAVVLLGAVPFAQSVQKNFSEIINSASGYVQYLDTRPAVYLTQTTDCNQFYHASTRDACQKIVSGK